MNHSRFQAQRSGNAAQELDADDTNAPIGNAPKRDRSRSAGERVAAHRLDSSHVGRVADILADAFYDYPSMRHLAPDTGTRRRSLYRYFRGAVRAGLLQGEVYGDTEHPQAAAVLLDPERPFLSFATLVRATSREIGPFPQLLGFMRRLSYLDRWEASRRKEVFPHPHWYYMFLGSDPAGDSPVAGTRLLSATLNRIDDSGLPCLCDAYTSQTAVALQSFGFELLRVQNIPNTDLTSHLLLRG